MKTAVVVPNWNGQEFLAECLNSLRAQTSQPHLIVVDNGSTDGSKALLQSAFAEVELIELDRNYGFAGGVNRGIQAALSGGYEAIALFNNDAKADPNWLANLIKAADEHPDSGIITGKLLTFDGKKIDSTSDIYSIWGFPAPRGRGELAEGRYTEGEYVFAATGGASLYRAEMLRQVGLFDERFFAYYEDQDISFRAQLASWKVWYEPTALAYHHIGGTSSKHSGFSRYHTIKNFVYVYSKNMPIRLYWKYFPRFLAGFVMIAGNTLARKQFQPFFKAVGALMVNLPGVYLDRWRIQSHKRVDSAYIDSMLYHAMPPTQVTYWKILRKLRLPEKSP